MKQNKKNQNEDVKGSSSILILPKMDNSLFGLKLLTEYLRKVDLHNPKQLKVKFENEEIKKILEVDNVEKVFLNKKLKELFISITIKDKSNHYGFIKMGLFEAVTAYMDEDGYWQIDVSCNPAAMKYILRLNDIGRS